MCVGAFDGSGVGSGVSDSGVGSVGVMSGTHLVVEAPSGRKPGRHAHEKIDGSSNEQKVLCISHTSQGY